MIARCKNDPAEQPAKRSTSIKPMKYLIPIFLIGWLPVIGCDVVLEEHFVSGDYVARTLEIRQFAPDTSWVVDVLAENGTMEMRLIDPQGARRVEGRLFIPAGVVDSVAIDQSITGTYAVVQDEMVLGLDRVGPAYPVPTSWTVDGRTLRAGSPYTVVLEAR